MHCVRCSVVPIESLFVQTNSVHVIKALKVTCIKIRRCLLWSTIEPANSKVTSTFVSRQKAVYAILFFFILQCVIDQQNHDLHSTIVFHSLNCLGLNCRQQSCL